MNFKISISLAATIFVMALTANSMEASLFNQSQITIKAIDEQSVPVEHANVRLRFQINSQKKYNGIDGVTKSDGTITGTASTNGHVGFRVNKTGYYESWSTYDFKNSTTMRWEPWNPEITVVLRKIENPVPMYARDTNESRINIPVIGKEIGFDFIVYDWVKPYGNGKVADLNCTLYVRSSGPRDAEYKVKINFPGQFNGIQSIEEDLMHGSEFKLPRFAPIDGYQKNMNVFIEFKSGGGGKWSYRKNMNYIFRIRSEVEKGKLVKAMYGKIFGDLDIGTNMDGTAFLKYKYYLNPDYTRNLEFDPKRNLFLNLPRSEQVKIK